jgi:hypothetical protein
MMSARLALASAAMAASEETQSTPPVRHKQPEAGSLDHPR